ncbi:hypothetical protein [Mesobacillus harenae]|uniref:hypothetical protein n=1 Tax=Mesobacillus harenae TaxID=2213203 RepID=UPI001580B7DD|nr:hypothetical protein [Mesobacillus harenae]
MKKPLNIIAFVLLVIIGVSALSKGMELNSLGASVDGDGIGIFFFGFEINDQVPVKSISNYTMMFFLTSTVMIAGAAALAYKTLFNKEGKHLDRQRKNALRD